MIVARTLASDAAGAEVMRALAAAAVPAILLKGPTLADWLYPGEARPYVDTDVLVAPADAAAAADTLSALGFTRHPRYVSAHAHPWQRRRDGAEVDLHLTIWGTNRAPETLWRELQGWVTGGTISGTRVTVLSLPARALFVALHAAQHRDNLVKPREDLRRALAVAPIALWRGAERLADRLWALGELADGLLLDPAGASVLELLPLTRAAWAVNHGATPLAIPLARLGQADGVRAKVGVAVRAVAQRRADRAAERRPRENRPGR